MALASVSPTVAGSKPKKLFDQTRDVLRLKHHSLRTEREHCENAQCSSAARSAQLGLKARHPFRGLLATGLRC
jgi:hypothetical protein